MDDEEKIYDPQIKYYHIGDICNIHIAACMYTGRLHYWRPFGWISTDIKSDNIKVNTELGLLVYPKQGKHKKPIISNQLKLF